MQRFCDLVALRLAALSVPRLERILVTIGFDSPVLLDGPRDSHA